MAPTSILFYKEVGHSQEGTQEVRKLLDAGAFDGPKPVRLIERVLRLANLDKDSIVLDFFSGSGTTAHAVMQLNAEDGGNRKFIMVQLPEETPEKSEARKAGYNSIDQIGRKRITLAAAKIREAEVARKLKEDSPLLNAEEYPTRPPLDLGFKHYRLSTPQEETLDKLEEFYPAQVELFDRGDILDLFGTETVLQTWLLRDRYGFEGKVQTLDLAGYIAYHCDDTLYFIHPKLSKEAIEALILKYELEPTFCPHQAILFGYSFTFTEESELRSAFVRLKDSDGNKAVSVSVRY